MLTKQCIFLFLVIILIPSALSEIVPYTDLYLTVKDKITNTELSSRLAEVSFYEQNLGSEESSRLFTSDDGVIQYTLTPGKWELLIKIDNHSTTEMDYYLEYVFIIDEGDSIINKTIYLEPVGSLEGKVFDSSGNLVRDADLKIKCRTEFKKISYPVKTDQFGSFDISLVPAGKCKIDAANSNFAGSTTVDVSKGESSNVEVIIDQKISVSRNVIFIIITIAVCAIVLMYILKFKPKKKQEIKEPDQVLNVSMDSEPTQEYEVYVEPASDINKRALDIISTLNEKETLVVRFMLDNNGETTHSYIYNSTGIPKTSLTRILESLVNKRVISIESHGKFKKIKLTDWFLEKE